MNNPSMVDMLIKVVVSIISYYKINSKSQLSHCVVFQDCQQPKYKSTIRLFGNSNSLTANSNNEQFQT